MGTVVLGERLVDVITNNVRNLYENRDQAAKAVPDHWYSHICDMLIPPGHRAEILKLPEVYFEPIGRYSIYPIAVDGKPGIGFTVSGPPRLVPRRFDPTISGVCANKYNNTSLELNTDDPRWSDFLVEYAAWVRAQREITNEREAAVGKAKRLLSAHRTLAPALKAWPALWELLPLDVRERHKTVTERKKRDTSDLDDLDLNDLTAQIAAKRIISGSK